MNASFFRCASGYAERSDPGKDSKRKHRVSPHVAVEFFALESYRFSILQMYTVVCPRYKNKWEELIYVE